MDTDNEKKQYSLDISQEHTTVTPVHRHQKQTKRLDVFVFYLGSAGSIGFAILVPLLIGIWIGVWIDSHYQTKPTFTLVGLTIGLLLSILNLTHTVKRILKKSI